MNMNEEDMDKLSDLMRHELKELNKREGNNFNTITEIENIVGTISKKISDQLTKELTKSQKELCAPQKKLPTLRAKMEVCSLS